ncbi:DUF6578 domain-containing protein [Phytoactinopolyspora mesophila]|uniref:Uncharacterized protein n=1 Tax=Phytoactinopolyspora mesophila TaxID=2650750 RepID=A0A7K3MD98_9ACTN|nr:DUF6578 domain-containing protein [Phytoactinopolyspora mesophila]NDL60378.1 hypothetical protein [Phytoactinopolyspora mesophila]
MRIRVWVDSWQMQCCGDPIRSGDTVAWTLEAEPDIGWLTSVAGEKLANSIDYHEEHHGGLPDDAPITRGDVTGIFHVRCAYTEQPDGTGTMLVPVPGSAEVTEVRYADGWADGAGDREFMGYVVDLEVDERPPHTLRDPQY